MTIIGSRIEGGASGQTLLVRALSILAALFAAIAAAYSGMNVDDKTKNVLPLVLVVAILLGVLAMTRFAAFVLILLGLRASIDLFKLSGSSAGNTATNTATARGLDPSSILVVLFLVAALLWLASQLAAGRRLKGTWLRTAMVSMGIMGFLSAIGSRNPQASGLEAMRVLAVVMMYVILEQLITDEKSMRRVILTVYASALFPIAYTIFQMALGDPPSEVKGSFTRISGPFSQSTTFARYLAFLIIFGVAILPFLNKREKRWMVPILSISGVFLLLTLTRGALFGCIVGLVVVAIVQRNYKLLAAFAVGSVAALLFVPGLASRLGELGAEEEIGGGESGNTLAWRLNYWAEVAGLVTQSPVAGIGLNMTQYNLEQAKQPHNDFLRTFVETGLVGFAIYLSWLTAMVWQGVKAVQLTKQDTFDRGVAAGFLGCAISFIGQSMGANVMSNVVSVWYLIAFAAAAGYLVRTGGVHPVGEPALSHRPTTPDPQLAGASRAAMLSSKENI